MATLTFVVYCLSQHPDVLLNLREEILTKIGPTRRPTFEDIKDCKYLRAVINGTLSSTTNQSWRYLMVFSETLRLYPAVYVPIAFDSSQTSDDLFRPFNTR